MAIGYKDAMPDLKNFFLTNKKSVFIFNLIGQSLRVNFWDWHVVVQKKRVPLLDQTIRPTLDFIISINSKIKLVELIKNDMSINKITENVILDKKRMDPNNTYDQL